MDNGAAWLSTATWSGVVLLTVGAWALIGALVAQFGALL